MKKLVKLIEMLLLIFSIVSLECAILGRLNAKLSWTTVVEKIQKAKLPQAVLNFLRIFSREEGSEKKPPEKGETIELIFEDPFKERVRNEKRIREENLAWEEEAGTDDFEDEQP